MQNASRDVSKYCEKIFSFDRLKFEFVLLNNGSNLHVESFPYIRAIDGVGHKSRGGNVASVSLLSPPRRGPS